MAGFPIVSLGSLVGISYSNCNVLMPQFEVDQYYQGDEERAIQTYKDRYSNAVIAGYIKNYTVYPNNLQLSEGAQSSVGYSYGFYFYNNISDYYGLSFKFNSISTYRVDSFYGTKLADWDYYCFMLNALQTFTYSNYVSIYINLPNIDDLENGSGFSSRSKVKNVFINSPKAKDIGNQFLRWNTTITDLYMNVPNIAQITGSDMLQETNGGETKGIYLHSLTSSDINRLYTLIYYKRSSTSTNLYKGTTCTYTDFDVRYWSEEQNSTGSDR